MKADGIIIKQGGTAALKGSKERSRIPDELCRHIVEICESGA